MSDHQIANHVGVAVSTVGDWRKKMVGAAPSIGNLQIDRRIVARNGKTYQQNTTNIAGAVQAFLDAQKRHAEASRDLAAWHRRQYPRRVVLRPSENSGKPLAAISFSRERVLKIGGNEMGSRGPIAKPSSIRSQRAKKKAVAIAVPRSEAPSMPAWLPFEASAIWNVVVADLQAAGVPLERIDAQAIAAYVLCILETSKAAAGGDTKLAARLGRDCLQWAGQIGATPASRARLNIKPSKQIDPADPWEQFDNGRDKKCNSNNSIKIS